MTEEEGDVEGGREGCRDLCVGSIWAIFNLINREQMASYCRYNTHVYVKLWALTFIWQRVREWPGRFESKIEFSNLATLQLSARCLELPGM